MPMLYQSLPQRQQLALAVRTRTPLVLARTFAQHVGQFYNRAAFDHLAREVSALYEVGDADAAALFRARLDRRLHDRHCEPVAWEVAPADTATRAA